MAYIDIRIDVPDGDYCNHCNMLLRGTIICSLFDEFVEETEDGNKIKCSQCKERMKEE